MSVIDWNGSDVPQALRGLSVGRYVVEPLDEAQLLSPEEEEGLIEAIESLRAGRGLEHGHVRGRILKTIPR
jgi:hypothetical protein